MKLNFITKAGNYPAETFSPPFFKSADGKWYFTVGLTKYGPFLTKEEAVDAFMTHLTVMEGVRV